MSQEQMNIVIVGHVDHGKSTLVGRLLADTDSLPEGKLESVKKQCELNSKEFEYAFLLDALKDEQSQGITIDTARCFFKTKKREYIIIDAPGHIEFLKNMISGASRAESAILLIDIDEGIQENSKRHAYMLSLLGIKQVVVAVNKMDLVNYDQSVFETIKKRFSSFLKTINIEAKDFIPISARNGDNITTHSKETSWYKGETILSVLDTFEKEAKPIDKIFRMPVQDVYKFTKVKDNRRLIVGRVETGTAQVGDQVIFLPSGKRSTISSVEEFNVPPKSRIAAGESTAITLQEQIFVKRGELLCRVDQELAKVTKELQVNVFWMGKNPLSVGKEYKLKVNAQEVSVKIKEIIKVLNSSSLQGIEKKEVQKHEVGECVLVCDKPIAVDLYEQSKSTGRFVLVENYEIQGGGIIVDVQELEVKNRNVSPQKLQIKRSDRLENLYSQGIENKVLWFTGFSGSGKSTIANALEIELHKRGYATTILDGDNIRSGLNTDLGFSNKDRQENLRRVAHVAKLHYQAGLFTIVSFISPYQEERDMAKKLLDKEENFVEIFVSTPLEVCEQRDKKGLYKLARERKIKEFTGISSPYQEPKNPSVIIDTSKESIEEGVRKIIECIGLH